MSPCHESESTFSFCYIKINVKFQSPFYSFLVIFTLSFYPRTNRGTDRQIKHAVHFLFNKTPTGTILLLIFTYLFHIPHAVLLRLFALLLLFFFFGWQQQCTSSFVTCCWNLGGLPNWNCEKLQYGQTSTYNFMFYELRDQKPNPIQLFSSLIYSINIAGELVSFSIFSSNWLFKEEDLLQISILFAEGQEFTYKKRKLTKWIGNSIWHTCISISQFAIQPCMQNKFSFK